MAVDHIDALEAVTGQGQHQVVDHRQQRGRLQAHGAGEAQVVFGHAVGLGGGHEYAAAAAHLQGHRFGGEGIGADGTRGPVLFGGAQGHDHPLALV